jgi:hypothetical protein
MMSEIIFLFSCFPGLVRIPVWPKMQCCHLDGNQGRVARRWLWIPANAETDKGKGVQTVEHHPEPAETCDIPFISQ